MCGIAGVFDSTGQHLPLDDDIQRMTAVLRHRGPDDEGYVFVDPSTGRDDERRGRDTIADFTARDVREGGLDFYRLAFGFRRLAIIDLSPAGHQPMASRDRSLWIVFNGELYNYLELRDTLKSEGHVFHTESDTEVVLSSYTQWGEGCLQKFNGMWAFALWDGRRRRLFCARDRFGIKPLYYTWRDGMFLFASEIKALLAANGKVERRPNQERVVDYLIDRRLDHTSETMFDGIAQISAGCHVSVDSDGVKSRRYWNIVDHKRSYAGYDDAVDEFRELFRDAVRLHLRSDVSTGSCLSGGIDSSSIVCMARKLWDGGGRIQTFSACFAEKECDESAYIASVHRQGKIDAHYIYPTASSLLDQLDSLVWHQEEPFVSSS